MAASEFTFLNGSRRTGKGIRSLDRLVLGFRGDSLPMHRWDELKDSLGDERYAIVEAWLKAMDSNGFDSRINGMPTGVTWKERLIVHAARCLRCTPTELFDKVNDFKSKRGNGIIFSKDALRTTKHTPAQVTSEDVA